MTELTRSERAALAQAEQLLTEAAPDLQAARNGGITPPRAIVSKVATATLILLGLIEDGMHDHAIIANLEVWIGEERK
ncbi:hypothetical protein [Kaistia adipata]|uniref:hypothetical protein n=1 Tax=Kaistia adipata TaxID=166954 RepID=UPI0003FD1F07|nr:hypothetical protein [Kaistia adipata]